MASEDILSNLRDASDDTEFFTPMPTGYEPGKTKYVVVFAVTRYQSPLLAWYALPTSSPAVHVPDARVIR